VSGIRSALDGIRSPGIRVSGIRVSGIRPTAIRPNPTGIQVRRLVEWIIRPAGRLT